MKNHLRKLSLLGSLVLLSTLVCLPRTQANRSSYSTQPIATPSGSNAFATNSPAALLSFANTTPIRVPGAVGSSSGPASPYPSVINVSGVSGTVSHVAIKLVNVNHTFPDDLDVLLVSPTGQNLIMMSDAGGGVDLVNNTITIDDTALTEFPDSTSIGTGTFRPTNYLGGDTFPSVAAPYVSPAPIGAATSASVFGGHDPNGDWQLFIVDDTGGDSGNVNGGWELIVNSGGGVVPCSLTCPTSITVDTDPGSCEAVVNYPSASVEGNCGALTYSHPSGSSFPLGTTRVTVTAAGSGNGTQTCAFGVTVTDSQAPVITTNIAVSSIGPPFDHTLVNVGLSGSATANCSNVGPVQVAVFSNEDEESSDDGNFSPDARDIALGTLQLRRERIGSGAGRIYLIISSASDASGNTGYSCNTVTVPLSNNASHRAAVNAQAAAAAAQCQETGAPPAGYEVVGDGPTIGPKQ